MQRVECESQWEVAARQVEDRDRREEGRPGRSRASVSVRRLASACVALHSPTSFFSPLCSSVRPLHRHFVLLLASLQPPPPQQRHGEYEEESGTRRAQHPGASAGGSGAAARASVDSDTNGSAAVESNEATRTSASAKKREHDSWWSRVVEIGSTRAEGQRQREAPRPNDLEQALVGRRCNQPPPDSNRMCLSLTVSAMCCAL